MGILDGHSGSVIRVGIAAITLAVAVFDVISDWIAFGNFVHYDGGKLTTAMGIFCTVATLLFFLEVKNCVSAINLYRNNEDLTQDDPSVKKLDRWQEGVSFLLMILEDLPNTIILYAAFRRGSCPLFNQLFQESNTANVALLASFLSALWKLVLSFKYCCCCCCNCADVEGVCKRCCCCCARGIRPLFAIILMGFSAFLFFTFNNQGTKYRADCYDYITTAAP